MSASTPSTSRSNRIGLALSGGGSRAVAFHLGCLRALQDRGVLDRVSILSGVSGGAVIGAQYAYCDADFTSFDAGVVKLLQRGLVRDIALETLLLSPRIFSTMLTAGLAAKGAAAIRLARFAFSHTTRPTRPPAVRRWSRTMAFERALDHRLYHGRRMDQPARDGLDIVITASELRTTAAFRFGSRVTSCYRWGDVEGPVTVAEAVAASAAYPILLPSVDRMYTFVRNGVHSQQRVILTDGGVFDNLGISCLEPGRSALHSRHVYNVDYIIACDAGHGIPGADALPYKVWSRVPRSLEVMHRKLQDAGRARLHHLREAGLIRGFVMPYLGQRDDELPTPPSDLVSREEVRTYPTDFFAMAPSALERISLRGEQLTRLLLDHYCPEL
jgi:NTE family protein